MEFNGTVLVVDDEPHIRRYIGLILLKLGSPRIIEAANGEEAVALFAQHQPDLVLMDVNMPIMDGIHALEKICAANPDALVVMLTSLATRHVVERCLELGAVNFVRKDTPKEMMAKVLTETINDNFGEAEA
ncbi:MAG TPA: response regulator transcription factor [Opitutaceae bacterium]|nr:response regulator transcription factor [Opitutaceae bacterium]